jgi:heavy metal sensor kinase
VSVPLKARLTLWYVTLFAVIVAAWSVFVVVVVRADLYAALDRALSLRAAQIAQDFGDADEADFPDIIAAPFSGVPGPEAIAQLLTPTGSVLQYSGNPVANGVVASAAVVRRAVASQAAQAEVTVKGIEYRILVVRVPARNELIMVGAQTTAADQSIRLLVLVMLFSGPLVVIAAAAGGWVVARRALRPVATMTSAAAEIGIDRLHDRVPVPGGRDEIASLALTLNRMLTRLEDGVDAKRRLIADASHELQTPLAVMRTELDVSLASSTLSAGAVEVLESAREETDRMTRIVRNLLTLARADEGTLQLLRAPVDLADVAEQAVVSLEVLAREQGVALSVSGAPAVVDGDAEYLRIVLVNLIENAIKYSGEGARVSVSTAAGEGRACVSVSDTGPGIPAAAQALVFDRFYRLDTSRSKENGGSGLGLAISQEIVEAHNGRIELNSEPGSGSHFTVSLPQKRS